MRQLDAAFTLLRRHPEIAPVYAGSYRRMLIRDFPYADLHAESVCIAGTFNDWHPNATPMVASIPGQWMKDLTLAPGTYEYCLIVDGHWKPDPRCEEKVENPFGGLNSVLRVPPSERRG